MAKVLQLVNGNLQELQPNTTSAGAADAGKLAQLDSSGRFDSSLMPPGFGSETFTITASETVAAGDFINIFNDTGTPKVRKADATGGVAKKADGYVLAGGAAGATVTVYYGNLNNQKSGLTPGDQMFLGTAGAVTNTPPTASGSIVQKLGRVQCATEILVELQDPIILV